MAERPLIFSAPMVRAILDGRKSMTRRVLKPQPPDDWRPAHWCELHRIVDGEPVEPRTKRDVLGWGWCEDDGLRGFKAPCQPGNLIWVRETWTTWGVFDDLPPSRLSGREGITYRASPNDALAIPVRWRSPIHMPRWASRITLRVTEVRVERLQEISEDDAAAEGVRPIPGQPDPPGAHRVAYRELWDSLHKPGERWDDDPWVCVIGFERVTP